MVKKTYKIGDAVQVNGAEYTLVDRRPGMSSWWGVDGQGNAIAIVASPARGVSEDHRATRAAGVLQKTAARISRSVVARHQVTETIDTLRAHADEECRLLKREEAEVVETGGALAQSAALTYLHHNHEVLRKQTAPRVRHVGTCPCIHRED